ncbi:mucin-2 isoform X2 [Ochlerotatus camptorhynchus]|uniref:mucin-2 isoform X2 n=1 Tax=Ochlerotatus camptorhynchus TaxID=644619 RepID=UPI0031D71D4D
MKVLLLVCSFTAAVVTALGEQCPDQTRPHATRCDQYFRCVLLPSKTHVWIPTKCDKGLIYEPQLKTCVLPGDEWECNLSAEVGNESGENVYGINNLPAAIYTGPTVNPVRLTTPLGSIESDVSVTENGGEGFVDGGVGGSNTEEVTDSVAATTIGQQQITNLPTVSGDNEGHQATIYDNLRNQIMNGSQYYNYQTAMVDSYGSRFPPQQVPNAPPMYPYPPPMAYPVYSQQNYQYPSNQQNFQYPNNQQTYQYPNPYYSLPQVMNRLRNTASYDNDNSQSNENTISDEEDDASAELPEKEEPSTPNEQSSEENDEVLEDTGSKKLISVGGYTLNYNDYKDSILPLLDANPDEVRISVLTCTLGSRQPNKTECTKYYVCNPHNGAFQSFTCPSFTAFNAETRVCDSATYKSCKTVKPTTTTPVPITLSRLTQNAHKTKPNNQDKLNKYVDMITKEAYKILSRNKIPTEYPEEPQNDGMIRITAPTMSSSMLPSLPSITMPTVPSSTKRLQAKPKRKHSKKRTSTKTNRKSVRKSTTTPTTTTTTEAPPKAPKCKKNGKMSDPAEKHNYYVCYKANPKKFIKTKMACPNNLVYCGSTGYCTYAKNCKN